MVTIYTNPRDEVFVLNASEANTTVRLTPQDDGFKVVGQHLVLDPGDFTNETARAQATFTI